MVVAQKIREAVIGVRAAGAKIAEVKVAGVTGVAAAAEGIGWKQQRQMELCNAILLFCCYCFCYLQEMIPKGTFAK